MGCSSNDDDHRDNENFCSPGERSHIQINNGIDKSVENKESELDNKISFRCSYDIKNDDDIQIINDQSDKKINEEIKSKIKILNHGKIEKLIFKKNSIKLELIRLILLLKKI